MKKYEVTIERRVSVEINEEKITDEVIKAFSETMWPIKGVEDILRHLVYRAATEDRTIGNKDELIEGLGYVKEFGIKAVVYDEDINIAPDPYGD